MDMNSRDNNITTIAVMSWSYAQYGHNMAIFLTAVNLINKRQAGYKSINNYNRTEKAIYIRSIISNMEIGGACFLKRHPDGTFTLATFLKKLATIQRRLQQNQPKTIKMRMPLLFPKSNMLFFLLRPKTWMLFVPSTSFVINNQATYT